MSRTTELAQRSASTLILINRDGMGSAEEGLRHKLLHIYLTLLLENEFFPGAICLYADGVRMVLKDSPVLKQLRALEAKRVHIVVCRTCLEHLGLAGEVAVGVVGGMHDIQSAQWMASKVITL